MGGENSVFRRCSRQLPEIWSGLVEYTGSPLTSRMMWEDTIRPNILQRFYNMWSQKKKDLPAKRQRWMRYALNRLGAANTVGFHVQHETRWHSSVSRKLPGSLGRSSSDAPKEPYIGIRLPQHLEALVDSMCPPGERERYCLRRFVVGMPVWDLSSVRSLTPDDVEWWFRVRRPVVVPTSATDATFDS